MRRVLFLLGIFFAAPAMAALQIFACTPEWASLAAELGGDRARIYTATQALQDPHRIEARPSLIARARRADLMVCTGADLEAGWAPLVQQQSGNPKIQAGQPGYFEAAAAATLIERPEKLDRAQGDVHPAGNPHVHLDPRNVARVAKALGMRMATLDAAEAQHYRARTESFLRRWEEASARWAADAARLKGLPVVVHHRDLSYLLGWLGLREAGALEPKPGIPPSSAHLAQLLDTLKRAPARAVLRSAYADPRPAEWLAERARMPAIVLPFTVGGSEQAKDLFGLYEDTLARLRILVP